MHGSAVALRRRDSRWLMIAGLLSVAAAANAQSLLEDPGTTVAELRARSGEIFRALAGADGLLTREEFLAAPVGGIAPGRDGLAILSDLFGLLDEDDDGVVTRPQWEERLASDLSIADENENGRVTLRELANARRNTSIFDALGSIF